MSYDHLFTPYSYLQPDSYLQTPLPPYIPISPPVPHRRAPRPPSYQPRRRRARHIRMKGPAEVGLFTLSEEEEEFEPTRGSTSTAAFLQIPSSASSDIFPSPRSTPCDSRSASPCFKLSARPMEVDMDLPRSVGLDEEMGGDETRRLSWESNSRPVSVHSRSENEEIGFSTETKEEPATPSMAQIDDPFAIELDCALSSLIDQTRRMAEGHAPDSFSFSLESESPSTRPRRPPPLNLGFAKHPFAFDHIELDLPTPKLTRSRAMQQRKVQKSLLPSFEILSPKAYRAKQRAASPLASPKPTSPTSTRHRVPNTLAGDHLLSTFEDLLLSCGEAVAESPLPISAPVSATSHYQEMSDLFPFPPSRLPSSRSCSTSSTNTTSTSSSAEFSVRTPTSASSAHSLLTTPRTPERSFSHLSNPPRPPNVKLASPTSKREKRQAVRPNFTSDHSFLFALSKGEEASHPAYKSHSHSASANANAAAVRSPAMSSGFSTASSSGSSSVSSGSSGGRGLPRRAGIPAHWLGTI